MKKLILLLFLCTALSALNRLEFNQIILGTSIDQVISHYGEPYAVHDLGNGTTQYEFIERIAMNNELIYENHYYLTVSNDKVVSKCFREENRPPYDQMFQQNPNYPTYP